MKTTFIAWMGYHRRSDILAQHLGATMRFLPYEPPYPIIGIPIKYSVLALKTWHVLCEDRPSVVFVQNPPIFCVLVAFLYAKRFGATYVIDSHTGAFLSPKWRWSLGMHRILSANALATIVHNRAQEKIVKAWGSRYLVIGHTPGCYCAGETFGLDGQFNVAVVSSFREDEPIGVVFEAATLLPDVSFYVTGDSRRTDQSLLAKKPDNCFLTGYLSDARYVGLLRSVDAVMVLTTAKHTLLMGGFEAVSLCRPLIVSDWPLLRDYFSRGTVYIPNSAEGVCEGVRRVQGDSVELQRDMLILRKQLSVEWERQFTQLRRLLDSCQQKTPS